MLEVNFQYTGDRWNTTLSGDFDITLLEQLKTQVPALLVRKNACT